MNNTKWSVDCASTPGMLIFVLKGVIDEQEMKAFVEAHNRGIDLMDGRDYKVWVDIRELAPLKPRSVRTDGAGEGLQ